MATLSQEFINTNTQSVAARDLISNGGNPGVVAEVFNWLGGSSGAATGPGMDPLQVGAGGQQAAPPNPSSTTTTSGNTVTQVNVSTALISRTDIAFIRPIQVEIKVTNVRPNTRVYPYFDGVSIGQYLTQTNGTNIKGDKIISDVNGEIVAIFDIPGMTFNTGAKEILFTELSPDSGPLAIGEISGSAKAVFTTHGITELFETTHLTTNTTTNVTVVVEVVTMQAGRDPLAETFFTHGIKDGLFITSIDLFFKSKPTADDPKLPVWIELREMIAGQPTDKLINKFATVTKNWADINTGPAGGGRTNFKFDQLIYLAPNTDYCMVVMTNSHQYNMWTSRMGEVSLETGKTVFDQPYSGSLMRSENNSTWTAEQYEDIKFTMYRAEFDVGVGTSLEFDLNATPVQMRTDQFYTFAGGQHMIVKFGHKHGLQVGDKVGIACDPLGVFNGVLGTHLNGSFNVSDVTNEYIATLHITYMVGAVVTPVSFTATGNILTGQRVNYINVDMGGSGYSSANPPLVTLSAPDAGGVQATAEAIVENGAVTAIKIINHGTKYSIRPTVTIEGAGGAGASAFTLDTFAVRTNRFYHMVNPMLTMLVPNSTSVTTNLDTMLGYYPNGNVSQYATGKTYPLIPGDQTLLDNNMLLGSIDNGGPGNRLRVALDSTNSMVSPILYMPTSEMQYGSFIVNNQQNNESTTATLSTGAIQSFVVSNGGTGYIGTPTVTVEGEGTGVTASVTLSSGVITGVNVITAGTGFYNTPTVKINGTCTTPATVLAVLTPFNSEKAVIGGTSQARYLTKATTLANPSKAIKVYMTGYSNQYSTFDVYIRSTLASSGVNHVDTEWNILTCDTTRNRSTYPGQYLDYIFYADAMTTFDVFSLKIVLKTTTPWQPPIISGYRAIALAA